MIHAISGWLTRHGLNSREQLARDNEYAAMNGWHGRPANRLGTLAYRDPRFNTLNAIRTGQAHTPADPTWAQAAIGTRIRDLPLTLEESTVRRCAR